MVGIAPTAGLPQQPASGPRDDAVGDDEGEVNASPEEQEIYERFVLEGFELLYEGQKIRPGVIQLLDEEPSDLMAVLRNIGEVEFTPVLALAATAALVTLEVVRRLGLTPEEGAIILHGGKAILEELAEIAEKSGLHDYSEAELGEAFRMGADLYREAAADEGLVNVDALKAEFAEIVEADRQGRLGEVLPELDRWGREQGAQTEQGGDDGLRG